MTTPTTVAAPSVATLIEQTCGVDPRWAEYRWALIIIQNAGLTARSPFDNLRDCIYLALVAEHGWTEGTWEKADRLAVEIHEPASPEAARAIDEKWARTTIAAWGLTPRNGPNMLKNALLASLADDDNLTDETAAWVYDLAWMIHEPAPPDDF